MNFKKLLLLLFLISLNTNAQEFKLGKVTKEELEQKMHPADTSAPAAYLFKRGKTYFDFTDGRPYLITEVECRIKIYKKEGYEYATEEVPYYTGGLTVRLNFDDAYTYNLVNGKIEKTKLKSDGEFDEEVNQNYSIKKITMPNVKEGSVIEYKYSITTPYIVDIRDWHFQSSIPVNFVSYEIAIPEYFTYNRYLTGYIDIKRSEPNARRGIRDMFSEVAVTYTAENVKALKDEPFVNNIENYMSILKLELASIQYPNRGTEKISTDWESVAKTIHEDSDFGKQLKADNYFKEDIDALLVTGFSGRKKIDVVFNYVRDRMNWNENFGYYCRQGVKKAYESKVGNVAEINLMVVSMLRYAGFDANPVLVSTRANGVALFPARTAYNYVVAGVKIDNELILLDATSKSAVPGVLPVRALNWFGRMIMPNNTSEEVDLMPRKNSREIINLVADIDAEGKVKGRVRDQRYDNYALSFREIYGGRSKDNYIESLEKRYKGLAIEDYNVSDDKDLAKPVVEDFTFTHNALSDVIGDKIYVNPLLFYALAHNPFKAEKREFPIDFTYPHQDKYMMTINIPEGYAIESLPSPIAIAMQQEIGMFKYNIVAKGNQIQLLANFDINYANVSAEYYSVLKDFYQKMVEKHNEKIVLTKKN